MTAYLPDDPHSSFGVVLNCPDRWHFGEGEHVDEKACPTCGGYLDADGTYTEP